jgi:hypothetical protein
MFFYGGRKTGEPGEKPLEARERTNNILNAESGDRIRERSNRYAVLPM